MKLVLAERSRLELDVQLDVQPPAGAPLASFEQPRTA
jgi:hypothetical protein